MIDRTRSPAPRKPKPTLAAGASRERSRDDHRDRPGEDAQVAREAALPVSLLRAREAVMVHMRPILRSHGFSEQQWRVLRKLDSKTPIDKTLLASRATLMMPSLLRILKDMEDRGLIDMIASPRNVRLVRVVLSRKGAEAVQATTAAIDGVSRRVRKHIGGTNVDTLLELLHLVEVRMKNFPTIVER